MFDNGELLTVGVSCDFEYRKEELSSEKRDRFCGFNGLVEAKIEDGFLYWSCPECGWDHEKNLV